MPTNGNYSKFNALYEYWKPICSEIPENNKVLPSSSNERISDTLRPWSLNARTIHNVFKGRDDLKPCNSTKELAKSIANKVSDYTCNVEWIGIDEICMVTQIFQRLYFVGDSQLRHMVQSLHMIFTNDFRYGGYPKLNLNKPTPFDDCGCDGQFSEHIRCRDFTQNFNTRDIRNMGGVCTHRPDNFNPFELTVDLSYGQLPYSIYEICTPDMRPKFIYLHGGSAYDTDPQHYYNNYLKPSLTSINFDMAICPWRSRHYIFYSGVPASSPGVAAIKPHQSEDKTIDFNAYIETHLRSDFPMVTVLNYWNLTNEVMQGGRTADGFHQLSDGNLIKSMVLLNAMKLMSIEHATLPKP